MIKYHWAARFIVKKAEAAYVYLEHRFLSGQSFPAIYSQDKGDEGSPERWQEALLFVMFSS